MLFLRCKGEAMKIGYARVSTKDQNLDRQLDRLTEAGCEKIFQDKISGKSKERPELQKCIEQLRKDDVLVVTELSRFARSMKDVVNMTVQLEAAEVDLIVLDSEWIDTTTPNGKFFFLTMALMDELKREIIVQNTKEGLQAARARGRKGGRPPVDPAALKTAMTMYESRNHSIREIVTATGISQGRLYNEINSKNCVSH